ncbi:hypothetical protein M409DRAFT_20489 [Zasmidium cellare ATCC 36951]|uniref:Mid2 domain-containing protein n=1 Tax=Zasmidium cellare ATCC 36951 TaxID=1080233 RepID=A0A6A6CQ97_ZASCE|nr:uncharacterized protein M409DRAFT_20489 [Zasmidium cellare ATCC 36951]KAF2169265.1 hypothetical protein M409DRAFT_20489 [Zasmidium cellare ATCC 36951]
MLLLTFSNIFIGVQFVASSSTEPAIALDGTPTATFLASGSFSSGYAGVFMTATSYLTTYRVTCTSDGACISGNYTSTWILNHFTDKSGDIDSFSLGCSFSQSSPKSAACSVYGTLDMYGIASTWNPGTGTFSASVAPMTVAITGNRQAYLRATQHCNPDIPSTISTNTTTRGAGMQATDVLHASNPKGLSGGTKAGIGVGISVAALLTTGILVFLLRFTRHRVANEQANQESNEKHGSSPTGDISASGQDGQDGCYTLHELEVPSVPLELPLGNESVELDAKYLPPEMSSI